ncbi:MAG: metallophosphoesterase [Oligoflexus sp.]|nr:metallophosphoesterase [Oligoflexus sp.]
MPAVLSISSCRPTNGQSIEELAIPPQSGLESRFPAAWVQLGSEGATIARVLTNDLSCPVLNVDGSKLPMTIRGTRTETFNITTCEATLPARAQVVMLGHYKLPVPTSNPKRIVVIGDTGCEIKEDKGKIAVQNCSDPQKWPFMQVSQSIASMRPDLIIHVGDYHYREVPCPKKDSAKCAGASVGDTWASWKEDWFTPAAAMFASAPLILARGNHELCARAGNGWFQFLDPRPLPAACTDSPAPYWMTVGDHHIAVVDAADDKNMQSSFDTLKPYASGFTWWVMHRPFLTDGADDELSKDAAPAKLPTTWQAPGLIGAVITGHKHLLSLNSFPKAANPPEIISGNGGTTLEKPKVDNQVMEPIQTADLVSLNYYDYGFLVFDRMDAGTWQIQAMDRTAKLIAKCTLTQHAGVKSALDCKPI